MQEGVMEAHSSAFDAERLLEHVDWIGALARRLVADGDVAEDIVQETWASALEHRPASDRPLRPWLASVLRNFARERRRSEAHRKLREEAVAVREALPSSAELAGTVEWHKLLVELVLALDEPYRETVILRTFRGLSSAEIARDRGVAAGTVRWRLKVGLDALREELDRRHGGDRSAWCAALLPLAAASEKGATSGASAAGASSFLQGVSLMSVLVKLGLGTAVVTGAVVATIALMGSEALFTSGPLLEATRVEVSYAPIAPSPDLLSPDASDGAARSALAPEPKADAPSATPEPARARGYVRVRVLDEDDRPLAGVELSLRNASLDPARTGMDGVATLAEPESGWPEASWIFELTAPGFARARRIRKLAPGDAVLLGDVELAPGGDVLGRIVDSQGIGLAGAFVAALTDAESVRRAEHSDPTARHAGAPDDVRTRSAEDGHFRLVGVPVGYARIFATEDDHRCALSTQIEVRVGEEARGVVLALAPLAPEDRIEGIVLTHEGEPVPHASLACERPDGGRSSGGSTRGDGRFRVLVREAGPHHFTASDPNDPGCAVSVRDVPEGTLDLELVFPEPRFFELEAHARGGSAVASYAVEILTADGKELARMPDEPRPEGIARVRVPGESFLLHVFARGFDRGELGPLSPDELPERLACTLVPLPGVRGVVVGSDGPIAGAEVSLMHVVDKASRAHGFPVRLFPYEPGWFPSRKLDRTTTDSRGEFAITVRERETYALLVEAEGFAIAEEGPLDVDPQAGVDDLVVELGRGGALDVSVRTEPGRDPTGAVVGCSRGDGRERVVRVGPDGRVRFESLTPGRWQVELRDEEDSYAGIGQSGGAAPDELPWNCEVREGETTEFVLWTEGAPGAALDVCRLKGTFTVDGASPGNWSAVLVPLEEASSPEALGNWMGRPGAMLDPKGRFELETNTRGPARLVLMLTTGGEADQRMILDDVDLQHGDNAWVCSFRTGAVEGFATAREDGLLFCLSEGPGEGMVLVPIVPDASGRFACSGVPAGRVRIVLLGPEQREGFDPKGGRTLAEVDVPAGKTARVDVR